MMRDPISMSECREWARLEYAGADRKVADLEDQVDALKAAAWRFMEASEGMCSTWESVQEYQASYKELEALVRGEVEPDEPDV